MKCGFGIMLRFGSRSCFLIKQWINTNVENFLKFTSIEHAEFIVANLVFNLFSSFLENFKLFNLFSRKRSSVRVHIILGLLQQAINFVPVSYEIWAHFPPKQKCFNRFGWILSRVFRSNNWFKFFFFQIFSGFYQDFFTIAVFIIFL